MKNTVLVTGASAGIGKATAIYLAQNGYDVYGAARRVEKMQDLKEFGIKLIALDVTNDESMVSAIEQIYKEAGSIGILVNNAGFGLAGALEDVTMDDARYQLEVNLVGVMRLTQLVLPGMREHHYGKIVNVTSIGGKIAFPLNGWYHASKFALEGLSDALRLEVKSFGIDVIVIEPGGIRSEWAGIANDNLKRVSGNGAYKKMVDKAEKTIGKEDYPEPIVIAKLIKTGIESKKPKTRYSGGYGAKQILAVRRVASDKIMDKIISSRMK